MTPSSEPSHRDRTADAGSLDPSARSPHDRPGDGLADEHLLREAERIAVAVGRMFPGLCEVALHDLRRPRSAIRVIENDLSGRQVGDPATEREFRAVIDSFAAGRSSIPRSLNRGQKRELVRRLHREGFFEARSSAQHLANQLGISRATVHNHTK